MCDEYHGNTAFFPYSSEVNDYWNYYRSYYCTHNISDWLGLVCNNGIGGGHNSVTGANSTSWDDLLKNANAYGMNEVWVWADHSGDETGIKSFCSVAWGLGWLQREYAEEQVYWTCDDSPCQSCVWGSGNWSMESNWLLGPVRWQ